MFKIVLKEFRCWKNLSIDIPLGGVTLIKGDSGCGKSTILQAIIWCLYGKIQLVAPITKKVASTEVTIEFPFCFNQKNGNLNITRKKSTRVTLSHNDNMYEDKVAQEIINDLFGTYDLWLASCYVGQGTRNTFLTAPNSGKMELLNSLAFHEEDPRIFIDKITDTINEKNTIYNIKLSEYNNNILHLETMMFKININQALSQQQHEILLDEINKLNLQLINLKISKQQYDIDSGILNSLYQQLNNLEEVKLPTPNNILKDMMMKYNYDPNEYDYNKINDIIMLLYQKEKLLVKLVNPFEIDLLNDNLPTFSMEDYHKAINDENVYNFNYNLLLSLNIDCDYDEKSIKSKIEKMKNDISYNEYLNIKKQYDSLLNDNTSYIDTSIFIKESNEIRNNIDKYELSEIYNLDDIIPCPDYSKYDTTSLENDIKLLYQKLQQPIINEHNDECNNLKQKINDLKNEQKCVYQNNKIESLNLRLLNLTNDLNKINNEIYKLTLNNKTLNCPKCLQSLNLEDDKLIISNIDHIKYNDKIKIRQTECDVIVEEINIINIEINNIKEDQIKQYNILFNQIQLLSDQILTYDNEHEQLKLRYYKEINDEIHLVRKKIDNLIVERQNERYTYEKNISIKKEELLQEKHNKLNKLKDEYNKLELKIVKLNSDNNVHINNQKQIQILESRLSEYKNINNESSILSNINDLHDLKNKLQKLNNIAIVEKSLYSSEYILKCINYNNLKKEYNDIIDKIPEIWKHEKADDVKFYNENVNEYINSLNINQVKKNQVDLNRKTINDQIDKIKIIDDPINRINEITDIINNNKNMIDLSDEANKVISYRDHLITEREKISKMNSDLVNLHLLKQHALDTECRNLQDVISSINSSIENVCSTLFDREISIILSLFKPVKSTKSIKPNVNFQISYKGGVFDNINSLSGGEGDRTSIALTLSLYRLTSFPLLMLDETLASLHYDMKEATVETLASILNNDKNRCVIVVLHDSVNGIFENVIDLEEITEGRY